MSSAPVSYLDHAATTPMRPEAIAAMTEVLAEDYGNPSGVHRVARRARLLLDDARERFADAVGASPHDVVFTGCGTESLNLAMTGARPPWIAYSAIEHDAVREAAAAFARLGGGAAVPFGVGADGVVDPAAVHAALPASGPGLVALMAVNNEVGTLQPVVEVAALAHDCGALVCVDAVQALSWLDVRPITRVADFTAFSAHKFGGPKGVGALVVRGGRRIEPQLHGGGQEHERRSGTQNVAGVVAMAVAAECADRERTAENRRIGALRDRLVDGLVAAIPGCSETVARAHKVVGNAHVCIDGIISEELLVLVDREGVCASAGSACASGALHVSPVLMAMGVAPVRAAGALRLTLGRTTTDADVERVLTVLPHAVAQLRGTR